MFNLFACVYIKGNALRMHLCSEASAKPKIVGRVLPANLSSCFLSPFDVFVIICIGQFLEQFPLVQLGFIYMKDVTDTVGSLLSIIYCLNVALTTSILWTVLLKTCLANSEVSASCVQGKAGMCRSAEFLV